jgi:hypothetical protein
VEAVSVSQGSVLLIADVDEFVRVMAKVVRLTEKLLEDRRFRRMAGVKRRDAHHPANLPIDGAAYHRRRNARRRRR